MTDLTTLARARAWVFASGGSGATATDSQLSLLITSASAYVLNYIHRTSLAAQDHDERYDSAGRDFILLRNSPVISVSSLQFGGVSISDEATGNPPASGYLIGDQREPSSLQTLTMYGYCFPRGRGTVRVQYRSGCVVAETHVAAASVTTTATWLQDEGVTLAGVAMTKVTGAPASGQYAVSSAGVYSFNAAQVGQSVVISLSYVPQDIEQAVVELVGDRFKAKDRIGLRSKNLPNGEGISFDVRAMGDHTRDALSRWVRVVPL